MKYALNIGEDGRILSVTFEKYVATGQPLVGTIPEGNICDYRYENGNFVHDPLPESEQMETPEEANDLEGRIQVLEEALEMILSEVTE